MKKTYELFLAEVLSPQDFAELYQPLKDCQRELGTSSARLQGELDALRIGAETTSVAIEDNRILYSQWDKLDAEAKRTVVETVVEKITVGDDDVVIDLAYLPYSDGVTLNITA